MYPYSTELPAKKCIHIFEHLSIFDQLSKSSNSINSLALLSWPALASSFPSNEKWQGTTIPSLAGRQLTSVKENPVSTSEHHTRQKNNIHNTWMKGTQERKMTPLPMSLLCPIAYRLGPTRLCLRLEMLLQMYEGFS